MQSTLENQLVKSDDISKIIDLSIRIFRVHAEVNQTIRIKAKPEEPMSKLLQYVGHVFKVAPNFLNLYYETRKLNPQELLFRT